MKSHSVLILLIATYSLQPSGLKRTSTNSLERLRTHFSLPTRTDDEDDFCSFAQTFITKILEILPKQKS